MCRLGFDAFCAVSAAIAGAAADAAAELAAEFFTIRAVEAGMTTVALEALCAAIPVQGVVEIQTAVAAQVAAVKIAALAVAEAQGHGFAVAAVIHAGADFGDGAAALVDVADGIAFVVSAQGGVFCGDEGFADVQVGFGDAAPG